MQTTTRIRFREDTAQNWRIANPVLASSEPGRETDTGKFKLGDGKTAWNDLPYATAEGNVTVDNTEVLNTLNINQTETTSNLTSIQTKLNEIEALLKTPQEPVKSFDEQLAEMGYCMVTYVTDSRTITEMNKIGEFYNHLYYDKHTSQREIFMGYSLSPNSTEVITSVTGKCTLYPVYVKAPEVPININIATTLDGYWNCTTEDLIYESIGRTINGLNNYGMALAGFSLDPASLTSITNFNNIEDETTFYGPVIILGYDKTIRTVNETDIWYTNEVFGPFYKHPINVHLLNNEVYSTTVGQALNYCNSLSIGNIQYEGMGFSLDTGIEAIIDDINLFMRDPNTANVTDLYMVYDIYNHETDESSRKNATELINLYDIHVFSLVGEARINYSSLSEHGVNYVLTENEELVFEGYSLNGNERGDAIVVYPEEFIIKNNIKTAYCVYSFKGVKYNYFELNSFINVNILGRSTIKYPISLLNSYSQESFTVDNKVYEYLGLSTTPYPGELINNFNEVMWFFELYVIMTCDGEPISYQEACEAYKSYSNS